MALMEQSAAQEQRERALLRANEMRLRGAEIREKMGAGRQEITADLLADPALRHKQLGQVLAWQRNWGRSRASDFLRFLGVTYGREVGQLTDRQRLIIASCLAGRKETARQERERKSTTTIMQLLGEEPISAPDLEVVAWRSAAGRLCGAVHQRVEGSPWTVCGQPIGPREIEPALGLTDCTRCEAVMRKRGW